MKLLEFLNEEERTKGEVIRFSKTETLYQEGDTCEGAYFVLEGKIKIASYTLEGREIIYNNLDEGEIFGNNLAFSEQPQFRGAVTAETDGALLFFKKETLLSLLSNNKAFLEAYLHLESEQVKALNAKMKILSLPSAYERLYFYLSLKGGHASFTSITSLASTLFLQRETLSRLLHEEAKAKRILLKKGEIIKL